MRRCSVDFLVMVIQFTSYILFIVEGLVSTYMYNIARYHQTTLKLFINLQLSHTENTRWPKLSSHIPIQYLDERPFRNSS